MQSLIFKFLYREISTIVTITFSASPVFTVSTSRLLLHQHHVGGAHTSYRGQRPILKKPKLEGSLFPFIAPVQNFAVNY